MALRRDFVADKKVERRNIADVGSKLAIYIAVGLISLARIAIASSLAPKNYIFL